MPHARRSAIVCRDERHRREQGEARRHDDAEADDLTNRAFPTFIEGELLVEGRCGCARDGDVLGVGVRRYPRGGA
jgi:hypothetical protein